MANPHYRERPGPSPPPPPGLPQPVPASFEYANKPGPLPPPQPAPARFEYTPYQQPYSNSYSSQPASMPPQHLLSSGKPDPAAENRKVFIGGIGVTGVDEQMIRYDFSRFGEIEDCFVPADRNEPGKIRGIAFVTYRDAQTASMAIREMHERNYHGREITCNLARPRGPDPKKDGSYHTSQKYDGKYDAGGKIRQEYKGTSLDPEAGGASRFDPYDARYDRADPYGRSDAERERDYRRDLHTHGASYDGTGRYGDRDPRPVQDYYD